MWSPAEGQLHVHFLSDLSNVTPLAPFHSAHASSESKTCPIKKMLTPLPKRCCKKKCHFNPKVKNCRVCLTNLMRKWSIRLDSFFGSNLWLGLYQLEHDGSYSAKRLWHTGVIPAQDTIFFINLTSSYINTHKSHVPFLLPTASAAWIKSSSAVTSPSWWVR